MWEIENNPDVLCIDKDETAEEFLCDAYGVVKPTKSAQKTTKCQSIDDVVSTESNPQTKIADDVSLIKSVEKEATTETNLSDVKLIPKKDNLLGNLEFSDDESEDMTPLYSKLIIIAGSQDLSNDKPDSSSANHEAEALNTNLLSNHIKACWVMVEKLSQADINRARKVAPEYSGHTHLLSQQCVTTINKESKVIDTIIIDSDDNHSSVILLSPEKVTETKHSDIMPKSKQISIPRWPKPLFEKCMDNLRNDKTGNPLSIKKPTKMKDKADKKEKRDKNEEKKIQKEVELSFDNLFNKKFNLLGSGFKIAKKVSTMAPAVIVEPDNNDSDDSKEDVIDLVLEFDDLEKPPENKVEKKDENEDNEDIEAEKWCKAQNWGTDEALDDIGILEECGVDDDDESNSSWTKPSKDKNITEMVENNNDVEFMDMVDLTRSRRREKYMDVEEMIEEDDVQVITGDEVVEAGEDFIEDFEDGFVWRPIEPEEYTGRGKWFEIDKLNSCNSPPRFSDLVEKKVIKHPEVEPVYTDRFYDLWADSKPRRNNQGRPNTSFANRFNSPYKNQIHSPSAYPQMTSQRDPRVMQRFNNSEITPIYCDTDRPRESEKVPDKSTDVWRRHIELKTKRNSFVSRENSFSSHNHNFVPQENQFLPQRNMFSSPGNIPPQFINLTEDYQNNDRDSHCSMSSQNTRDLCRPYPYHAMTRPPFHPLHPYYNDPRLFYGYYQHLLSQRGYNRMFLNSNRAPVVPYTPESPDPEMMDDYDPSQNIVKKESLESNDVRRGADHLYYHNNQSMFTPASPDPVAVSSPDPVAVSSPDPVAVSSPDYECNKMPMNGITEDHKEEKVKYRSLPSPEYLTEVHSDSAQVKTKSLVITSLNAGPSLIKRKEGHVNQDVDMGEAVRGDSPLLSRQDIELMMMDRDSPCLGKTSLECALSCEESLRRVEPTCQSQGAKDDLFAGESPATSHSHSSVPGAQTLVIPETDFVYT